VRERHAIADREVHHGAVGPHLVDQAEPRGHAVVQVAKLVLGEPVDVDGHGRRRAGDQARAADVAEARAPDAARRHEYNHHRPHSSPGCLPPAAFAATLAGPPVGTAPYLRPGQRRSLPLNADSHSTWYRKRGQVSAFSISSSLSRRASSAFIPSYWLRQRA